MNLLRKARSYYHYLKGDDLLSDVVDLEERRKQKDALAKSLLPYDTGFEVFSYPVWGAAVWDCVNKKWVRAIFADGQELNLEHCEVELHEDGIEILSWGRWPEEE